MSERLWAIRGAAQADANDEESILAATRELVSELMARNGLEPENFVSVIFTATDDLDAQFPAVAARELGFGQVPLLCNREMDVPGGDGAGHPPAGALLRAGGPHARSTSIWARRRSFGPTSTRRNDDPLLQAPG